MIFSIGMPKTGTTSLAYALRGLGLTGPLLYGSPEQIDTMYHYPNRFDFANGLPFWSEFERFDCDFPGSKFILTVRSGSVEEWLESYANERAKQKLNTNVNLNSDWYRRYKANAFGSPDFVREEMIHIYETHNERVFAHFRDRPDDLLVMNLWEGDGWEKLCAFVNRPIPPDRFPHKNKRVHL